MKKHILIKSSIILIAFLVVAGTRQHFESVTITNSTGKVEKKYLLVESTFKDPIEHFDWMPKLHADDYHEPEWNYIRFGNNPVRWITFRRGIFGNNWNGWQPAPATEDNAVILQSSFEPIVIKTNGVWIITFKDN